MKRRLKNLSGLQKCSLGFSVLMIPVFTVLYAMSEHAVWKNWRIGALVCILNAVSILFADELFRLSMSFHVQNASKAEPSSFELFTRKFGWVAFPLLCLLIFVEGLLF